MKASNLLVAICSVAALSSGGCASMHPPSTAKNRVVIQVSDNDPARWNLALNNARNLQSDLRAANVEIEIVAYGPGLSMVKAGSAVAPRIDESVLGGMNIVACENTMAKQKVTKGEILPGVNYVGAGVVEIMRRQQQGLTFALDRRQASRELPP